MITIDYRFSGPALFGPGELPESAEDSFHRVELADAHEVRSYINRVEYIGHLHEHEALRPLRRLLNVVCCPVRELLRSPENYSYEQWQRVQFVRDEVEAGRAELVSDYYTRDIRVSIAPTPGRVGLVPAAVVVVDGCLAIQPENDLVHTFYGLRAINSYPLKSLREIGIFDHRWSAGAGERSVA